MFTSAEAASHCDWLHSVYVYIKRLMYSRFRPHFLDINLKVNAFHQIFTVETSYESRNICILGCVIIKEEKLIK